MNKRTIIKLIAAMTLAACVAISTGCSNEPQKEPERTGNTPSEITAKPDEQHFVFIESMPKTPTRTTKSEDGSVIYKSLTVEKFSITQKARVDKAQAEKMQAVITNAINRHDSVYLSEQDVILEQMHDGSLNRANIPYETKVFYDELRNDGRAISILETIESYSAGALTTTTKFCYNFDPVTGSHITTDIFYKAGDKTSLDAAEDVMLDKITDIYGDVVDYSLITTSLVDTAQTTWYFTKDGIVVFFRAGEIADESVGEITINYTKSELPEFSQKHFA